MQSLFLLLLLVTCIAALSDESPKPVSPLQCTIHHFNFASLTPGDAFTQANDGAWTLKTSRLTSSGKPFSGDASAVFDSRNPPVHERDLGTPGECAFGPGVGAGGRKGKPGQNCESLGNLLIAHNGNTTALRQCKCEGYACGACQPNDAVHGAVFKFFFRDAAYFRHAVAVDLEGDEALYVIFPSGISRRIQGLGSNSVQKVMIDHYVVPGQTLALRCTGSCAFAEFVMDVCLPIQNVIEIPHTYDPRPSDDIDADVVITMPDNGEPDVSIMLPNDGLTQFAVRGVTPGPNDSDILESVLPTETTTIMEEPSQLARVLTTETPEVLGEVEPETSDMPESTFPDTSIIASQQPVDQKVIPTVVQSPEQAGELLGYTPIATTMEDGRLMPSMTPGMITVPSAEPSIVEGIVELSATPEVSTIPEMVTPMASILETFEPMASIDASNFDGAMPRESLLVLQSDALVVEDTAIPKSTPMILESPDNFEVSLEPSIIVSPELDETFTPESSSLFEQDADMANNEIKESIAPTELLYISSSPEPETVDIEAVTTSTFEVSMEPSVIVSPELDETFTPEPSSLLEQEPDMTNNGIQESIAPTELSYISSSPEPEPVDIEAVSTSTFEVSMEPSIIVSPELDETSTPEPSSLFEQNAEMTNNHIKESMAPTEMLSISSSPELELADFDTATTSAPATITMGPTSEVDETMFAVGKMTLAPTIEYELLEPSFAVVMTPSPENVLMTPIVSAIPWPSSSAAPSVIIIDVPLPTAVPIAHDPNNVYPCDIVDAPIDFADLPVGSAFRGGEGFLLRTYRLGPGLQNDTSAIFDTSNPRGRDYDLGAPNVGCPNSGPGVGEGGKPRTRGSNCEPLGMALISHRGDVEMLRRVCETCPSCKECAPDDNPQGAYFVFEFTEWALLRRIVMLDVDELPSSLSITDTSNITYEYAGYGDNSKLVVDLKEMQTSAGGTLKIRCAGSCAVIEIDRAICAPKFGRIEVIEIDASRSKNSDSEVEQSSMAPPEESDRKKDMPSEYIASLMNPLVLTQLGNQNENQDDEVGMSVPPVNQPGDEIKTFGDVVLDSHNDTITNNQIVTLPLDRPRLSPLCPARNITFQKFRTGMPIMNGDHWKLETCRIEWDETQTCGVSAAFNTSSPGYEDRDLGAPHEACGGVGRGYGGAPNQSGRNCRELGMVLIAAGGDVKKLREKCAKGVDCSPNDHAGGAEFLFSFDFDVRIIGMTLMDLDDEERSASITTENTITYVKGLGDNSVQTVYMSNAVVGLGTEVVVHCSSSCAIISVMYSLCL